MSEEERHNEIMGSQQPRPIAAKPWEGSGSPERVLTISVIEG